MRGRRPAAWTLTLALTASLLATCIPVEAAPAAQLACCVAMNHDCGPAAEGQDCCVSKSAQAEGFTVAKRVSVPEPSAFPVFHALVTRLIPSTGSSHLAFDQISRLSPPGVPRYLLTATLLI